MKISIPIRLLHIEGDGHHLAVTLHLNGKAANAILDTGASKTVFDKEQITAFLSDETIADNETLSTGLGTTTMQSHIVMIRKMRVGKLKIENYQSVVLDLSHVNATYEQLGLAKIAGVLGSDILEKYKAVIDYGKRKLFLTIPAERKAVKKIAKKKPARKSPVKKAVKKVAAKKVKSKKRR